jgi:hypothetical protein
MALTAVIARAAKSKHVILLTDARHVPRVVNGIEPEVCVVFDVTA